MPVSRRDLFIAAGSTALTAGLAATAVPASAVTPATTASPTPTATPTASPTAGPTPPPVSPTPPVPEDPYPLRLTDFTTRDPYVVADEETGLYHLFASNKQAQSGTAGVGTMVYRSPDLQRWSRPVAVFIATPDLWGMNGGWAPEVHRWRGHWYLFTTLHNPKKPIVRPGANASGIPVAIPQYMRGTVIARSDSLLGPFAVVDPSKPVAPADFMTLDGTLFADAKGKPWMVYAHEWVQKIDGTIEAIPLKKDLSGAAGRPIHLFKGSDATWLGDEMPAPSANQILPYVTDGPQLIHLPGGALAMLWSTFEKNITNPNGLITGHYVETLAVSKSGRLQGPWVQQRPLLRQGTGHGMVFRTLPTRTRKSRPMLIAHRGVATQHAKLWEIALKRDTLKLGKQRKDLDGTK